MTGLQVTEITAPTDSNKYYNLHGKVMTEKQLMLI